MTLKRPVHPILIVLPLAAFTLTVIALAAHAATGDDVWYRGALFADVAGLAIAAIALFAGVADAAYVPAFTVARQASVRQVLFTVVGLAFFAVTAIAVRSRYAGTALGEATPLVLGVVGLTSMMIADWYGRIVLRAFEDRQTTVLYPARMRARATTRRPGSALTIS